MNSSSESQLARKESKLSTIWSGIKIWFVLITILSVLGYWQFRENNSGDKVNSDKGTRIANLLGSSNLEGGNREPSQAESQSFAERLKRLESSIGKDGGIDEKLSIVKTDRAVQKAQRAALTTQAAAANRDLSQLKKLQAQWVALETSLLEGEPGKRVVGSPKHFERVLEIWHRRRPTTEQMVEWETKLNAISEPLEETSEKTTIAVTAEYTQMLESLCQELSKQRKEFEQQTLFLGAIQAETSGLKPGDTTLVAAIERHRAQADKAEAERITAAGKAARSQAEKEQATRIAALERELVEVKTKREEQRLQAEKDRLAQLAIEEKNQISEEARIQELKSKAIIAGLKEEATRVEEELQWAQLEREMNRDSREIKGLLMAFTSPGFTNRPDGTKGPVSFSKIKSAGGLEPTRKGLQALFFIATGNNDRPIGGLPPGVGGHISDATSTVPIERAQALLKKYGDLMVRKELLAP